MTYLAQSLLVVVVFFLLAGVLQLSSSVGAALTGLPGLIIKLLLLLFTAYVGDDIHEIGHGAEVANKKSPRCPVE